MERSLLSPRKMTPWRDERGRFVSKRYVQQMRRHPRCIRTVVVQVGDGHG